MKYSTLSFILLPLLLLIFSSAELEGQGWQQLTSGLPSFGFLSAVDTSVCWVAGGRMLVMRTTNANNFSEVTYPLDPTHWITAIYARSASLAWVTSTSQIYKTTDGGANWTKLYEYTGPGAEFAFFDDIYFWDDLTGIAISDQVLANPNTLLVVRTTDGGSSWATITSGLPVGNGLYGICAAQLDAVGNHCWFPVLTGSQGDTTATRYLIHSRDKGLNWETIAIPGNFGQFGVSFSDTSRGIIIGPANHIAQTSNGGQTWQMRYDGITTNIQIKFAKGTGTAWAQGRWDVNAGRLVAKSTDYGATWTTQAKPVPTGINGMSVVNQNYVWMCGPVYSILRTSTGGSVMAIAYPGDTPVPSSFELMQNYPNPFNPVTTIKYRLEESGRVRLTIYDELGREIRTLMDQRQNAGWHQVSWDGRDNVNRVVATGTYFYTLKGTSSMQAKKMILLK